MEDVSKIVDPGFLTEEVREPRWPELCAVPDSVGFSCVCILVLTTSSGHVMVPANPPALAAVKISNPRPISLLPTQSFAQCCACS